MPARRTQGPLPDLFTTAADTQSPLQAELVAPKVELAPAAEPASPRHLLPKDLPGALKHLNDSELDALLEATIDELKRRDQLPSRLMKETSPPHTTSHPREPAADDAPGSLTKGRLNAVRAAFKAGVKPSAIARQFGISQSDVRKALACRPTPGRGVP
jgi:hypothetical protein